VLAEAMRATQIDRPDGGHHFPLATALEADRAGARAEAGSPPFSSAASTRAWTACWRVKRRRARPASRAWPSQAGRIWPAGAVWAAGVGESRVVIPVKEVSAVRIVPALLYVVIQECPGRRGRPATGGGGSAPFQGGFPCLLPEAPPPVRLLLICVRRPGIPLL